MTPIQLPKVPKHRRAQFWALVHNGRLAKPSTCSFCNQDRESLIPLVDPQNHKSNCRWTCKSCFAPQLPNMSTFVCQYSKCGKNNKIQAYRAKFRKYCNYQCTSLAIAENNIVKKERLAIVKSALTALKISLSKIIKEFNLEHRSYSWEQGFITEEDLVLLETIAERAKDEDERK